MDHILGLQQLQAKLENKPGTTIWNVSGSVWRTEKKVFKIVVNYNVLRWISLLIEAVLEAHLALQLEHCDGSRGGGSRRAISKDR